MTNFTLGRWLLVALAIVGLAVALPVASAHGTDTTAEDAPTTTVEDAPTTSADGAPTDDATGDEWATWMEAQMTEHMGPGSVEEMESHMGVTVDEMGQDMAGAHSSGGMGGQGHC